MFLSGKSFLSEKLFSYYAIKSRLLHKKTRHKNPLHFPGKISKVTQKKNHGNAF